MDEEVVAWKTQKFWRDGQPFLIGGGTPLGFHLGPAFYYLSALPLIFTKGDPIGWIFLTSLVSISTFYLMYLVGKTLYSETVGLTVGALWAFSFTTVSFDRHWWPLAMDPLFSLLTMLSLFHILKGRPRWWIVLSLTLSFAWQADLTNLVLFLAAGVIVTSTVVIPFLTRSLYRSRIESGMTRSFLIGCGILMLSFSPLIFFELRHPGANLGKFNLIRPGPANAGPGLLKPAFVLAEFILSTFASLLVPNWKSNNISDWYIWCKDVAASRISTPPTQMVIAAGFLFYPLVRWVRKRQSADFVMMIMLASGIGGMSIFRFLGGDLFDFYVSSLYPVFLLSVSFSVVSLSLKFFKQFNLVAILTVFTVFIIYNVSRLFTTIHPQSLAIKQQAVAWVVGQVGDRSFSLESMSRCHRYNGIRYLFMLEGKEPVMSFTDPDFSWLYDAPPATTYPATFVAFVTPDDLSLDEEKRYNVLIERSIARKRFGAFDVVIVDNHDQRYHIDFASP